MTRIKKKYLCWFWHGLTLFIMGDVVISQPREGLAKLALCPLEASVQSAAVENSWFPSTYFYSFSSAIHHHYMWSTSVTAFHSLSSWARTRLAQTAHTANCLGKRNVLRGTQRLATHNTVGELGEEMRCSEKLEGHKIKWNGGVVCVTMRIPAH